MKNYLQPIYENVKSYYKKAVVTTDSILFNNSEIKAENEKHLYSYGVHICYIDADNNIYLLPCWNYSMTTLRHLKEFLKQNGFKADNKKQIEKDYLFKGLMI